MKNHVLISIFFLLLLLPLCSSVQIEMKSSYDIGETLLAKVSGNFLEPILNQDIYFYRRHMPTTMDFNIVKIDSDYYLYAQIPFEKLPDNYSILIQGVKSIQGAQTKEEDIFYNFSITNKTADFSIEPAVLTAKSNFNILVQNLQDKTLSIKVSLSNKTSSSEGFWSFFTGGGSEEDSSFSLSAGESKSIPFVIENFNEGLSTIKISSENLEYPVPVKVTKEPEKPDFSFEDSNLETYSQINLTKTEEIFVVNSKNKPIYNISLSLSSSLRDYVNLSKLIISEIKENSKEKIEIVFFSMNETNVDGTLEAEHEGKSIELEISFHVLNQSALEEYESKNNISNTSTYPKTCAELNGIPCGEGMICNGTNATASDERFCCVGPCNKLAPSSIKKILGWSLLIIGLLVLSWFLITKYARVKRTVSLPKFSRK